MEANPRDRWRRKRFKENLDRLLTDRGLTRKAAAKKAEVKEQWLRRAVSKGIAWPDKRSKQRLQKLADALGLDDIERLWGRDLIVPPEPPEPSSIKDGAAELGELMRTYVMQVGVEDATLQGIVVQIEEAIRAHRHPESEQARRARLASKSEENPPPSRVAPQPLTFEEPAEEAMRIFKEGNEAAIRALSLGERSTSRKRSTSRWADLASKAVTNAPPPAVTNAPPPAVTNAPPMQDQPKRISGEEEILARTSARQLVAHVLTSLSPEQSEFFLGEYPSAAMAQRYVEIQLYSRIRGGGWDDNGPISAQSPDEALQAVIAEIIEDHDEAGRTTGASDSDHPFDEPITLEEKPLETRHGDDETPEATDDRGSLPVGSALEAEIASSLAEDRAAVQHVDEILQCLGDTPHPSGRGTYLESLKRLGNPRSVAEVALSEAGGNTGKALEWLVGKVDKSIEDERAQTDAMRQTKLPQGRKKAPATRKRSKKEGRPVEMSHEDFRRLVTTMRHEDGLSVRDIITALWDDVEGVSDWVRKTERTELTRMIRDIIAQHEPVDDGPVPEKFNYKDQDALEAGDGYTDPP